MAISTPNTQGHSWDQWHGLLPDTVPDTVQTKDIVPSFNHGTLIDPVEAIKREVSQLGTVALREQKTADKTIVWNP